MVEWVKNTFVGPWVGSGMKTFVTEMASMDFTNEREGAVEMSIPSYWTKGKKRNGRKHCARPCECLETTLKIVFFLDKNVHTSKAEAFVDAKRNCNVMTMSRGRLDTIKCIPKPCGSRTAWSIELDWDKRPV